MKYIVTLILFWVYVPTVLAQPHESYSKPIPLTQSHSPLRVAASEICGNRVDDDYNGLTDDKDFACYFKTAPSSSCNQSPMVWATNDGGDFFWVDLSTGAQRFVGSLHASLGDITWASDGKLYGCGGAPNGLWIIDPYTGNGTPIYRNLPNGYYAENAMTSDAFGNLYLVVSLGPDYYVIRLNINDWTSCLIADLHVLNLKPAGDLTFINGKLYLSCTSNEIAVIDVRTGQITTKPLTGPLITENFGMASIGDGYLYVTDKNKIYRLDPTTMAVNPTPVYTFPYTTIDLYGLAAYSEFCQAPKCTANTNIQPATSGPWCSSTGVQLLATVTACNSGPIHYTWTKPDGTIVNATTVTAIQAGKYYLNYQTATEVCNNIDSFNLQYTGNSVLKVDTTYRLPNGCACTGSMTVTPSCGSGNYKYEWSTGANTATVTNVCPGSYTVKVSDVNLSKDTTISFNITQSGTGIQNADITVTDEHCNQNDGSVTVSNVQGGAPPYQFSLNSAAYTGNTSFLRLSQGTYTLIIKDNNGCMLQKQANVDAVAGPGKIWVTQKDALCGAPAGSIIIDSVTNGSKPFTFSVDNSPYSTQNIYNTVAPGTKMVSVKDNYGCVLQQPVTINQTQQLNIQITPQDTVVCVGEKISLKAIVLSNSSNIQFSWNNTASSTSDTYTTTFNQDTPVILQATDNNGCTAGDTITVAVKNCDSTSATCIVFPNAFSPNGDGHNDTFGPHRGSCIVKNYKLVIYNRWGQIIFQTTDVFHPWNGSINGIAQETGTYLYTCTWEDASGIAHNMKGTIVLIR